MEKYITGVVYRHGLLTAYLKVIGRTQAEAERRAKRVGTVLHEILPKSAEIRVPRYRGFDRASRTEGYEIPILIATCERSAKAKLAKLVLRGAA